MANRDLTPWRNQGLTPFGRDPFAAFRREMDQLFDEFFVPAERRSFAPRAQERGLVMPSIDVHESEQAYTVSAELPGIDQKDIQLDLRDNALTIRGEKRSERNEEDAGLRYSERSFGRFERTIPLPSEVDADRVEATCENGVLKITLPKNAKASDMTRRIEIKGTSVGNAKGAKGGSEPSAGGV